LAGLTDRVRLPIRCASITDWSPPGPATFSK